jgi:hypothetical protein
MGRQRRTVPTWVLAGYGRATGTKKVMAESTWIGLTDALSSLIAFPGNCTAILLTLTYSFATIATPQAALTFATSS